MFLESSFIKDINKKIVKPDILRDVKVDKNFDIYIEWSRTDKEQDIEMAKQYALPDKNGKWEGKKGDSTWRPDSDHIPQKHNPEEKTWGELLGPYDKDGVDFKDGEPDFTPFAVDTVEIEDFTIERDDNYAQADEALAKKWSKEQKDGKDWTAEDVQKYRKENQLSWHERSDQKTMDLVPREIHGNIPHSGGISEAKKSQGVNNA